MCLLVLALQRAEVSESEQMPRVPPSVAARSLSSTSTEASTSRQSSVSPGTAAPVNGQSLLDVFVSYIIAVAVCN